MSDAAQPGLASYRERYANYDTTGNFHRASARTEVQGGQQAVQIDGPGKCIVSTTCTSGKEKVRFCSDYANGTNTLQFGAQTVRLTRGGRLLLAVDQSVDLSEGCKVIHLKWDSLKME